MKPNVGRIVHYRPDGDGPCLAALVASVHPSGNLNLVVFDEVGDMLQRFGIEEAVDYGSGAEAIGGQWHWPERADA